MLKATLKDLAMAEAFRDIQRARKNPANLRQMGVGTMDGLIDWHIRRIAQLDGQDQLGELLGGAFVASYCPNMGEKAWLVRLPTDPFNLLPHEPMSFDRTFAAAADAAMARKAAP